MDSALPTQSTTTSAPPLRCPELSNDRDRRRTARANCSGLALADFSSAEVQEFLRLLIKLNTTLQAAVEPGVAAGTDA